MDLGRANIGVQIKRTEFAINSSQDYGSCLGRERAGTIRFNRRETSVIPRMTFGTHAGLEVLPEPGVKLIQRFWRRENGIECGSQAHIETNQKRRWTSLLKKKKWTNDEWLLTYYESTFQAIVGQPDDPEPD